MANQSEIEQLKLLIRQAETAVAEARVNKCSSRLGWEHELKVRRAALAKLLNEDPLQP